MSRVGCVRSQNSCRDTSSMLVEGPKVIAAQCYLVLLANCRNINERTYLADCNSELSAS